VSVVLINLTKTYSNNYLEPLGIEMLCSTLKKNNIEFHFIDGQLYESKEIIKKIKEIKPNPELIGISVLPSHKTYLKEFIKNVNLKIPIVIGGYITIQEEEKLFFNNKIKAIVLGRGEEALIDIIKSIRGEKDLFSIPILYFKKMEK
jgi:radical SAM superfamily enzyme YgiQ (UPF0313 family)